MWLYKNKEISSIDDIPTDMEGFVYKIIHTPTNQFYIGKKSLWSKRNVKIGKRETEQLKEERKKNNETNWWSVPKKKKVIKESDWIDYYSSNDWIKKQVKKGKKDEFIREIIEFYTDKKKLTYYELYWQFHYNVLADEKSLNSNLIGKFYKQDII
jgi:F0F1-type ATP synthase gamma subunit